MENQDKRTITDKDITKYEAMIESFIKNYVVKNWNEASMHKSQEDVQLGNSGFTMSDFRQHMKAELCIALYNYDPNYRTSEGRSVKESTFVYQHLFNRVGQLMKKLTKRRHGYGIWTNQLESVLREVDDEKS
jgi:hypothetical protein